LNNLTKIAVENREKIVEAGALPHYVKLLNPERDESEQREAARGILMLAATCKDSILDENLGCVDGIYRSYTVLN